MRRGVLAIALLCGACTAPDLGDLPARCDTTCPSGYACVHGVCTRGGEDVPTTIAEVPFLHGYDLRVLPQASTALAVWQTYAYSADGEGFVGARVDAAGDASSHMQLVNDFSADPGAVEPYYDVLPTAPGEVLLAVSASPLPEDVDRDPRLIVYRVDLPGEGSERLGAKFAPAWDAEERLGTIGYGAVSKPRLVANEGGVELGYVRTLTKNDPATMTSKTEGELAVFELGSDGSHAAASPSFHAARFGLGLPVAVGVEDAYSTSDASWWILDDARPSVLRLANASPDVERPLALLAVPVAASPTALSYIAPSHREGQKLPTDRVSGPASLHRMSASGATLDDATVASILTVRDTPRPRWLERVGKPAILVSGGADASLPSIAITLVDPASGAATAAGSVDRMSTAPLIGLGATIVGGSLFVVWAEQEPGVVAIRARVLREP